MFIENTDDEWGNKVTLNEESEYVETKDFLWVRIKEFAVMLVTTETGVTIDVFNASSFSETSTPLSSLQLFDSSL